MGSYVQIIVGGLLLVTAFLFGRYINNQPLIPGSSSEQIADADTLNRKKIDAIGSESDLPENELKLQQTLQQSLRQKILGERRQNRPPIKIESPLPAVVPQEQTEAVVVPDFSRLEFKREPKANPIETNQLIAASHPKKQPTNLSNGVSVGPITRGAANNLSKRPPKKHILDRNTRQRDLVVERGTMRVVSREQLVEVRKRETDPASAAQKYVAYKTVFGDTLHGLSSRFFGKPDYYLDIYMANTDRIENPSTVPVDTTLRIPIVAELINRSKE